MVSNDDMTDHMAEGESSPPQNAGRPQISIITPVYGCAGCLTKLYARVVEAVSKIVGDFEIIMVNDGSPDDAWSVIEELARADKRVIGINLSRNFGQHHAITAGLDFARGDWVVVMDCDLQDQPEEIRKLYAKAMEGYDVVFGRRVKRGDNASKKWGSRMFYWVLGYFTDTKFDPAIANFSIVSSKVLSALRSVREQNRNFVLAVKWMGFKTTAVEIDHVERPEGQSSYTFRKLLYFAYDIIVAQSNKPLRLSIKFGFLMSFLAFAYGAYLTSRYFFSGVAVAGWTSTMVSIYFVGGLLLANMGVLGLYIGKVFNETKDRPIYVISETLNMNPRPDESRSMSPKSAES